MRKSKIIAVILVAGLFWAAPQVIAGGRERFPLDEEIIGIPPAPRIASENITRHKGKGEPFYLVIDFFSRILSHNITPGDKKPGPGYGVPEGHNIGNAPLTPVVGAYLDRNSRGNLEPLKDFLRRIEYHETNKHKNKSK